MKRHRKKPLPRPRKKPYALAHSLHAWEDAFVLAVISREGRPVSHVELDLKYPHRFNRSLLLKTFKRLAGAGHIVAHGYSFSHRRGGRLVHYARYAAVYGPHLAIIKEHPANKPAKFVPDFKRSARNALAPKTGGRVALRR